MKSPLSHLIVACIACIGAVVGYGYWYAAVGAKSIAVANLENKVATRGATANRIASSRASLAEIAGDEATIQNYFVSETGVVAFIDSLQSRGKALGAAVDVLSVSSASTTAVPSLVFSLSVTGPFSAVMSTVGAIEYAPYDLTISAFSLTKAKDTWRTTLSLLVGSAAASKSTPSP